MTTLEQRLRNFYLTFENMDEGRRFDKMENFMVKETNKRPGMTNYVKETGRTALQVPDPFTRRFGCFLMVGAMYAESRFCAWEVGKIENHPDLKTYAAALRMKDIPTELIVEPSEDIHLREGVKYWNENNLQRT